MMSSHRALRVAVFCLAFLSMAAVAAASLPTFSSDSLDMGGKPVLNAGYLSVATALSDGNVSDNLTINENGTVNTTALTQLGASSGQVLAWDGSAWGPADDTTAGAGSGIVFDGSGNHEVDLATDGGLELSSGLLGLQTTCSADRVLKFDGSSWSCAADADTTAGAGQGLVYDGSGNLDVDLATSGGLAISSGLLGLQTSCASGEVLEQYDTDSDSNADEWRCADYVRGSGDTMSGSLNMGSNNVTGVEQMQLDNGVSAQEGDGCASGEEGAVTYNGTHHLGCSDSGGTLTWKMLY
jgi:hypothetical protein